MSKSLKNAIALLTVLILSLMTFLQGTDMGAAVFEFFSDIWIYLGVGGAGALTIVIANLVAYVKSELGKKTATDIYSLLTNPEQSKEFIKTVIDSDEVKLAIKEYLDSEHALDARDKILDYKDKILNLRSKLDFLQSTDKSNAERLISEYEKRVKELETNN